MMSCRQRPTVLQEDLRQRPDLTTLTCVNPDCQRFRLTGQNNLTVRKVYGQDRIRLLRCRTCGEEFSERRGTALFNTKIAKVGECPLWCKSRLWSCKNFSSAGFRRRPMLPSQESPCKPRCAKPLFSGVQNGHKA